MSITIHYFNSVGSTNDIANLAHYGSGDCIVAEYQHSGRGQRGSTWVSEQSQNLTFSIVVEPENMSVGEQFLVSRAISVALCRVLEGVGLRGVEVKWPNDILVCGKKIAGVLVENSIMGDRLSRSVVGVGLNVNQRSFVGEYAWLPTSIAQCGVNVLEPLVLLRAICREFFAMLEGCEISEYMQRLYRGDGYYRYCDVGSSVEFEARVVEVNKDTGELSLELDSGEQRSYWFKEVRYI